MNKDPLDVFNRLAGDLPVDDAPDYPGTRRPKNRDKVLDNSQHEWLNDLPSHEYLVHGNKKRFYTIGAVALALQRKPVTIRSWESKGWLPPATFRTPAPRKEQIPGKEIRGRRLYSEAQVVFLREMAMAFEINDPNNADWKGFKKAIADNYPNY